MTEEDAKQQYEDNAQAEAQRLLNYLEVFYPNDEVNERATQLVKDIYAKAQYSVGEGNKLQGGDFAVEVILLPHRGVPSDPPMRRTPRSGARYARTTAPLPTRPAP